ncbi:hypothetical protein VFPPC_16776 [Pochonia chlamydosporia 170]|uniref:Uncharacterized protein n=1 Tax=Pochonia chlamydosporia 170 TaxID=1380566 RepID=A0A179F430_METCM|nr:hypothetical protein VFPPC_16776 [Pochonia chlamydosporia 170]OAQ60165.1 hypothetical protein VFPPC_16776 [Pochonia chlamydosporia 170]
MSTRTLLALPPEIIGLSCESICPHCTPGTQPFMSFLEPWDIQYRFERQKDLVNFSLTCSCIRSFAVSHRFHCVTKTKALSKWTKNEIGLLAKVREFVIDEDLADWFPQAWDPSFCTSYATQHLSMDLTEYRNEPLEVFAAEFVLASLTNLRNLTFHVDNSEEEESNIILYKYVQELGTAPALSHLETLNIHPRDIDFSSDVHCTNLGIRMLIKGHQTFETYD